MLNEILKERGMTQGDLATAVGVTRSAISSIASAKEDCSINLLAAICSNLNIPPDQVLPVSGEHSLHTVISRLEVDKDACVGAIVGDSAASRARQRGCGLELAGWCGIFTSTLFQMNGSMLGCETVYGLVAQVLDLEEAQVAAAVIYETLSDPAIHWLRRTCFPLLTRSVFLLSPVRQNDEAFGAASTKHIKRLEKVGLPVHYPLLDTPQNDPNGAGVVLCNVAAIAAATEVHAIWKKGSEGSGGDLQVTMVLGKPFFLVNADEIEPDPHKSYTNVALLLDKVWRAATNRRWMNGEELAKAAAGK